MRKKPTTVAVCQAFATLLRARSGAAAIEYSLAASLIAAALSIIGQGVGAGVSTQMSNIASALDPQTAPPTPMMPMPPPTPEPRVVQSPGPPPP